MEFLKSGRLQSARENLAGVAVQAKVLVRLLFLGDTHDTALRSFANVSVNSVLGGNGSSRLQATLSVDEVSIGQTKAFLRVTALSSYNDALGLDNVRNATVLVRLKILQRELRAAVRDNSVLVEARIG